MVESWTTEQELRFIKNLGTHRQGYRILLTRLKLLEKYVQTARARFFWGTMNGERVITFAETQLAEEQLKPQPLTYPHQSPDKNP